MEIGGQTETPTYNAGDRGTGQVKSYRTHDMSRAKRRFFNYNETCHTKQTNNALANCT